MKAWWLDSVVARRRGAGVQAQVWCNVMMWWLGGVRMVWWSG